MLELYFWSLFVVCFCRRVAKYLILLVWLSLEMEKKTVQGPDL